MLTERLKNFFDYMGVEWVMVLLLALGLIAVIVIVERYLFFRRHQVDIEVLARDLRRALESEDLEGAMRIALGHSGMEGRVIAQGIRNFERGPEAVEEEIQGALSIERAAYDKYLPFLGTLGNNAPFIGLFGTVLGIISAFSDLQEIAQGANRAQAIMGSISEALVATAVGLLVAIPSVIAYNQFKGMIKERIERTGALSGVLLAHLKTPQKPKF